MTIKTGRDLNIDAKLDLSKETLMRICKGDPTKLPTFVVYRDRAWPWVKQVRIDKMDRIHIRKTTFLRQVVQEVPVRPGIWTGPDSQAFYIDLKPHDLGGGEDTVNRDHDYKQNREIAGADNKGRYEEDHDYGTPDTATDAQRVAQSDLDDRGVNADGTPGGVARDWLARGDTEDS